MIRKMDGWMGWRDGKMDGWMDRWIDGETEGEGWMADGRMAETLHHSKKTDPSSPKFAEVLDKHVRTRACTLTIISPPIEL